jgi:glycerophosphoryl diester phosphodiesterase
MRGFRVCLVTWLLAAGALHAEELTVAPSFHIQAHRGAGIAMPENTLETFRWSWKRKVTPEADLRTTKDDEIVCFHDTSFKRVVRGADDKTKTTIESLPLSHIQKLDVGSFRGPRYAGQRVPTLASVFADMYDQPERLLYIDVKTVDLDQLAKLVKKHGVERQVIFTTSEHPLIRDWKKRMPESMTLLWNGGSQDELTKKMDSLRKTNFEGITHLQIHVKVGDLASDEPFMPRAEFLQSLGDELAKRGIVFQVLPWKCSDQRAYERLLGLGVDSFATDYPEVTLAAVRSFREKQQRQGVK